MVVRLLANEEGLYRITSVNESGCTELGRLTGVSGVVLLVVCQSSNLGAGDGVSSNSSRFLSKVPFRFLLSRVQGIHRRWWKQSRLTKHNKARKH